MSFVHTFAARVVRPEWGPRLVTGLAELPEDTGTLPPVGPPDPAAYDDAGPAVYVYRQSRGDLSSTGVVCEVSVAAFVGGQVRGHEAVQLGRVESLVKHQENTEVPPALVALLHHAGPTYERTIEEVCATPPLLDFTGPQRLRQQVWRVPAGAVPSGLVAELASTTLYIADGHHRVAAELATWRRDGEPAAAGVLCVVHPMDGLRLSAFHRRVSGPVDLPPLLALLRAAFAVAPVAQQPTPTSRSFGLYAGGEWYAVAAAQDDEELDVELLQRLVLDPLGRQVEIAPAKTAVDELTRRCDSDEGVLFTLAPPPLAALTRRADAGLVMPPKTTYFEPKPCAGIFRRP